jgi:hypothetical protein
VAEISVAVVGSALERHPWAGPRHEPLGPDAEALRWLAALLVRRDWCSLWALTDANLRLASAQRWLDRFDRAGDNVTAWSLAAEVPHVGVWAPFAGDLFSRWASALSLGVASGDPVPDVTGRRRISVEACSAAGRELCVVTVAFDTSDRPPGSTCQLTLRRRDRWRVAGLGAGVLQPGWPPRWLDLLGEGPTRGDA